MNQEKAREFFSAYYEGTLEKGLKQTFEQRLRADSQIQAEYRAFERTMSELDSLKFEDIEVPFYLSDRIATRMEEARAATQPKSAIILFLPRFLVGAAATLAIGGTLFSLFERNKPVGTAGFVGGSKEAQPAWPLETVGVDSNGRQAMLHYNSATARTVKICDEHGLVLKTFELSANQPLTTELANSNPETSLFEVTVSGNGPDDFVAVPGSKSSPTITKSGNVREFVEALADHYRKPVVLKAGSPEKTVTWNFDGADAKAAAQAALEGTGLEVAQTKTDVLSVSGQ